MEWIGEVDQTANDVMGTPEKPAVSAHRPAEQLSSCADWLQGYLRDGAKTLTEIEDAGRALFGFSRSTILRARKKAEIITFSSGQYVARDGKARAQYSCRLSLMESAQYAIENRDAF